MFWMDKRVFVTGHTGFKGGWLSLYLESLGAKVTGYSMQPPSTPNLFETARVAERIHSFEGDIRNLEHLKSTMADTQPEVVFHLAAQPLVRQSYKHPVDTFATNVMGTVNVLEAVRLTPSVRVVVIVTSDKCYENREWDWGYRETDVLGGYDPYSASKGMAEIVTTAYRHSFLPLEQYAEHRVAVASVRAGNVVGGGDWSAERLIPDIVRAFTKGEPVLIRSPKAMRPWQHALDALRGYMMLAERMWSDPDFADAWNFGPSDDDTKPVMWLVERMTELWGDGTRWEYDSRPAPREATLLKLDSSKAQSRLGWTSKLNLLRVLEWTVSWYKESYVGRDMRAVTLKQIEQYKDLVETTAKSCCILFTTLYTTFWEEVASRNVLLECCSVL
jgi:CDP-glucose 4,6-dehydratase